MAVTVGQMAAELKFTNLTPDIDINARELHATDVNLPAIQMTGFMECFDCDRVQVLGGVEKAYLKTLDEDQKVHAMENILSRDVPCLIYSKCLMPDDCVLELARKYHTAILSSRLTTSETSARVLHFIQKWMSETLTVHGVLVDIFGVGVMITGESGIGKSEAALELIKRGHRLVADDAVEIHRLNEETLIGVAPDLTKDFLEIRGIGVVNVMTLFGAQSIKNEQEIDMVVRLEEWDKEKEFDRLGNKTEYEEYLGNRVVKYHLPIRPGRNVAVILEAVAADMRQKALGYSAADELMERVKKNLML